MFARIVPVKNGKVVINGVEYTIDEAKKLNLISGVAKDDEGNLYVVIQD